MRERRESGREKEEGDIVWRKERILVERGGGYSGERGGLE